MRKMDPPISEGKAGETAPRVCGERVSFLYSSYQKEC